MDVWARYEAWNSAIVDVVFPELDIPEPVYLDFEDEITGALSARMGVDPHNVVEELAQAVSATLPDLGPASIFARHTSRLNTWERNGRRGAPPHVALLSVFSLAAEQMSVGDGMSSSNYFGRLRPLLGRSHEDRRLDQAYRRVAERMWSSLNVWLTNLDGTRGLPTAFALSQRFVGLSISQALVRHADREKLKTFFRTYGFAPGADVPPADLEQVLDSWINQSPCPVSHNLERLWGVKAARSRIAVGAAVALSSWDGSVKRVSSTEAGHPAGHLALTLEVGSFPRRRFAVSALFYLPDAMRPREATVLTASSTATLELVPDVQGALGLSRGSELHSGDVLSGVLKVRDELTGAVMEHRPRRMLLFREDEQSRRWVESAQVMLGDSVRLLVESGLVQRLLDVLRVVARPGWRVETGAYPGQPQGWSLVTGVEVLQSPGVLVKQTGMDDLLPLVPLTSSSLKVAGGFALPGQVRGKWHSWAPPEVRAISDADGGFSVTLTDLGRFAPVTDDAEPIGETLLERWSDDGTGVVVAALQGLELEDGDYRIDLVPAGAEDTLTSTVVRLRSSDTPDDRQWALLESVFYTSCLGVVGEVTEEVGASVQGAVVLPRAAAELGVVTPPATPWWASGTERGSVSKAPVRLTMPDAESCIYTGRHREQIDTVPVDARGRPLIAWSHGKCNGCGLERRYPTRLKLAGRNRANDDIAAVPARDLSTLPPVLGSHALWETAFDAVLHTGGGSWSHLERIALQVQPTALYVDQFARTLEVLGHIDVRRSQRDLAATAWEVSPTALVSTSSGEFFAGYWPTTLYENVGARVVAAGGEIDVRESDIDGPVGYFAQIEINEILSEIVDTGAQLVGEAWRDVAGSLPPLSQVLGGLPRQRESYAGDLTWYRPSDNTWLPVRDCHATGGFRARRFSTVDFVRSKQDLNDGTVGLSTVQLSKHISAFLDHKPLIAYDARAQELAVPLGADLPGLFGRAAVLASGKPPVPDKPCRLLRYQGVPAELAGHLYDLLSR